MTRTVTLHKHILDTIWEITKASETARREQDNGVDSATQVTQETLLVCLNYLTYRGFDPMVRDIVVLTPQDLSNRMDYLYAELKTSPHGQGLEFPYLYEKYIVPTKIFAAQLKPDMTW